MKSITTTDVYKAAYFIMYGGQLNDVKLKRVPEHQRKKLHIHKIYTLEIVNIPEFAVQSWDTGQAYGNITEYARVRWRLKEKIQRFIDRLHVLDA